MLAHVERGMQLMPATRQLQSYLVLLLRVDVLAASLLALAVTTALQSDPSAACMQDDGSASCARSLCTINLTV